jgi:hypothetical protein
MGRMKSFYAEQGYVQMKSNIIEVALDSQGKSRIVHIESPSGDTCHTLDLTTGIVKMTSNMGTTRAAIVTHYNVIELKCNGRVNRSYDCVPRCV